ncbi:MAG TPA: DNA polymerase III subunit gamma/tau [Pyrinomonadaceae bacterium]|jgi:DNA polymerase-3 subunit gamma/tau
MAYQVIARKWRPQSFDEVTGQELITRTLRGAIEHDRLHHAYLFSGARGVGKTTTARLLAKALNCHKSDNPTPTPCCTDDETECASCREIAEGRSIDVLEIDAASNTGVDNVRDSIINTVGVRPARDRYKVFIIDEVHMLSGAAFNALLKTLEEPPPRVVFIMATTESHKLPDTILSRCQQFEFRTIPAAKIAERLRIIADAEGIKVSDDALREVARAGEGSMRDAQSAFDQVISFSADAIEVADVETALGLASAELRSRVVRAIADETPAVALAVVDDLVMRGHDLRNFCRDLLSHLRDLLVVKVAGESVGLTDASETERREMAREAATFSESDIVRFFHSLTETERALRESAHPRYQLEIGLVKLIEMRRLAPVNTILERLAALEESLRTGKAPAGGANAGSPSAPPASSTPAASSSGGSGAPPSRRSGTSRSSSEASSLSDASVRDESHAPVSDEHHAQTKAVAATSTSIATPSNNDDASIPVANNDDAPPFEPLPPRPAPVASTPRETRVSSIPSLPSSAKTKSSAPAPVNPLPSLPKTGTASAQTSPTTQSSPTTLQASTTSTPLSTSTPTSPSTTPSSSTPPPSLSTTPPSSGLKLVPPPPSSPSATTGTREASTPFFFESAPAREEHAIHWDAPTSTMATAPARTEADAFSNRSAPTSNNVAASTPSAASSSYAASSSANVVASSKGVGASSFASGSTSPHASAHNDGGGSSLEQIKKSLDARRKPFLVIALEGARTVRIEGDELYVEYAPEGKHLRDTLAKPDNIKILREVCREVAGRDMGVAIVVKQAGDGDADAPRSQQDEALLERQRLREMAEQHPAVQQLLKTFGAEIIDVRRIDTEAQ